VIDVWGDLRRSPTAVGPRRPTHGARPFDGTTGGRGDARGPTGTRWWASGGRMTVSMGCPADSAMILRRPGLLSRQIRQGGCRDNRHRRGHGKDAHVLRAEEAGRVGRDRVVGVSSSRHLRCCRRAPRAPMRSKACRPAIARTRAAKRPRS